MSSWKWLILFGVIALVILIILNWGYRQALNSLETELDNRLSERLLVLAENLAVQIDHALVRVDVLADRRPYAVERAGLAVHLRAIRVGILMKMVVVVLPESRLPA